MPAMNWYTSPLGFRGCFDPSHIPQTFLSPFLQGSRAFSASFWERRGCPYPMAQEQAPNLAHSSLLHRCSPLHASPLPFPADGPRTS